MGWLYVGNFVNAIIIFIGYWIFIGIETFLATITLGFSLCLSVPLHLVLIVVSGIKVRDYVHRTGAKGSVMYVIVATIIPFLLICVIIALLTLLGPLIGNVFSEVNSGLQ